MAARRTTVGTTMSALFGESLHKALLKRVVRNAVDRANVEHAMLKVQALSIFEEVSHGFHK